MSALGKLLADKIREIPYLRAGFESIVQSEMGQEMHGGRITTLDEALKELEDESAEGVAGAAQLAAAFDAVAKTARMTL